MRLSTIIPAYNRADLIGETLRSVLEQTRPPDEVIVVDDGSSDGTPDIVAQFGRAVTLLRQSNAGAGTARNTGFARSTGEIVHFMDSDDLVTLNSYRAGIAAVEAGADVTYAPWLKVRIDGRALDPEPMVLQQHAVPAGLRLDVLALLVEWVALFQACFVRRDVMLRAGPYRCDLKPSEDTELLYRVMAQARMPVHVDQALLLYRVHPETQISGQDLPTRIVDRGRLWGVLQQHLASRSDLDAATRRTFRRKKHDVAGDVRPHDPSIAADLAADATIIDRALRPARHLAHRVSARWRVARSGDPYPPVFAAGPLTLRQRQQIHLLGYALPGKPASQLSAATDG
jgi:hypothetical protein